MSTFRWPLLISCLALVGCATAQSGTASKAPTAPSVDVTGTWNGTYAANTGPIPLQLKLRQVKDDVTGDAAVSGDGWTVAGYNGALRGTVSGNTFSYGYPGGGADLTVNGTEMRGHTSAGHRVLIRRE